MTDHCTTCGRWSWESNMVSFVGEKLGFVQNSSMCRCTFLPVSGNRGWANFLLKWVKSKDTSKEKARWWVLVCIKLNSLSIVSACISSWEVSWLLFSAGWQLVVVLKHADWWKKILGIVQKPNIQWLYVVSEDEVLTWYQQIVQMHLWTN